MTSFSQHRSTCTSPHSKSHRMFAFRSLSTPCMTACVTARPSLVRSIWDVRLCNFSVKCYITSSKRTVHCCSCFRILAVLILSPRSCVAHLCQHLVGLLKLVMDGLEFLADTCVHGLLHSLNAFCTLCTTDSPHRRGSAFLQTVISPPQAPCRAR